MQAMDRLAECIGGALGRQLREKGGGISELRIRAGRPSALCMMDGTKVPSETIAAENFRRILARLMGDSLYACEEELKQGYFTMEGGIRVGVCGRLNAASGSVTSMAGVGSLCIRIPREIRNSTAGQLWHGSPESMLILSPPGMGKTTLVREIARLASEDGYNVAIADERREIAACREGIPQFDLGPNTDVMDGCPKAIAMELLLRACAPQMIVADEIGGEADAAAIRDAARCGAAVVATAHAASFVDAENRFRGLFQEGIFCRAVLLGPEPGRINSVREYGSEGE